MLTVQIAILKFARLIAYLRFEDAHLKASVATSRKGPELMKAWDRRRELVAIDDAISRLAQIRIEAK